MYNNMNDKNLNKLYSKCLQVQESSINNLNLLISQFEKINQKNIELEQIKNELSYSKKLINSLQGLLGIFKNRTITKGRETIVEFKNRCKIFKYNNKKNLETKKHNIDEIGDADNKNEIEDKILQSLGNIKRVSIKFQEILDKEDFELDKMDNKVEMNRNNIRENIEEINELLK